LEAEVWGEAEALDASMAVMSNDELRQQTRALDNEIRIMRSDMNRIRHETTQQTAHIKDNKDKIKLNKQLPYLVANVIEIVEPYTDPEEDGAATDLSLVPECKGAVVKTSTRQTVFLPMPGLIRADELKPGELVGTNKDSYIILEKLPTEFDSRVKAMEVDEKPVEDYTDIGGLDKQIQELIEAVVLPMTRSELFESIGIKAPKGVLLYGPPGTGKTLLARACAKNTEAVFLKLAG
jgi:26S proteasome regulatory subunit T5